MTKATRKNMRRTKGLIPALVLGSAVLLGGCSVLDDILAVDAPSRVIASDLEDPAAASLLVASVANEFRCALSHYIVGVGLVGMEYDDASANTINTIWDTRNHDTSGYGSRYAIDDCGSGLPALYIPLSRTRWYADQVLNSLADWTVDEVPEKAAFEADVATWAGFTYVLFGESMCEVAFDGEAKQPFSAAFDLAVLRFDQAIAAGSGDIQNLARVGKARALLNLGQLSAASAAAAPVPAGFSYMLDYSDADSETRNKPWELNHRDDEITVGLTYRDLSFGGMLDPRAAVTDKGLVGLNGEDVWTVDKYPSASSQIEVGSWEEAQLIMAEFAVADGRLADAVTIIDALHTNAGLPLFSTEVPGATATEVTDQITYERSVEMFVEGHHLFDIKRLGIPLFPPVGAVAPSGTFYSDDLCFEIPAVEFQNNPNIG